jgi:hypothetical protein
VFDNASIGDTVDFLKSTFTNVYRADRNVGYWSAIHWWLNELSVRKNPPTYVYIIESDLVHLEHAHERLQACIKFLDEHIDYGSVRLYEWTYAERHLYDKNNPVAQSKRNAWRSHTNWVTGKKVDIFPTQVPNLYGTTFLTQLVAINRYDVIKYAFDQLVEKSSFVEPEFQRLYYNRYSEVIHSPSLTAIIEGGLFHCNLATYGARTISGSYTPPENLARLGYLATRIANIIPLGQYAVNRV